MTATELVFSDERLPRVARHLLFWAVYTFYFYPQGIWYPDTIEKLYSREVYVEALINFSCYVPVCILATYTSIYVLMPYLLDRKRYISFLLCFALLFLVCIFINFFVTRFYYSISPHPDSEMTFAGTLNLSYVNSMAAIVLSAISVGIKSAKNWHRQQKENVVISKKKIRMELQLQKARIHPQFLLRTLSSINRRINSQSDEAAEMVLRLSDLLSYSLYSGKDKVVSVSQELSAVDDFLYLQGRNNGALHQVEITRHPEVAGNPIPPMTVLCLLSDLTSLLNSSGAIRLRKGVSVELKPTDKTATILSVTVSLNSSSSLVRGWTDLIESCCQRLEASTNYVDYELDLNSNGNEISVILKFRGANPEWGSKKNNEGVFENV